MQKFRKVTPKNLKNILREIEIPENLRKIPGTGWKKLRIPAANPNAN